jgi:uncharacterized protein (TIGR03435 family)
MNRLRWGRRILEDAAVLMAAAAIALGLCAPLRAQSAAPDGEKAAGEKLEFEAASVRLNPGPMEPSNFRLSPDEAYANTGGLLSADVPLATYIEFAYKIQGTREQFESMYGHLPEWVKSDRYEIHARAPLSNPTKDQMRLMMQTLLKERFGVMVHYETKDTPVLVMKLVKPEILGPKLHRHESEPSCDAMGPASAGATPKDADIFPRQCGGIEAVRGADQALVMGGRNTTLPIMANSFASIGRLGRPLVDGTGLTGNYDFILKWTPDPGTFGTNSPSPSSDEIGPDAQGVSFVEALKEQLGLRLEPGNIPMKTLVIDHVERPSAN